MKGHQDSTQTALTSYPSIQNSKQPKGTNGDAYGVGLQVETRLADPSHKWAQHGLATISHCSGHHGDGTMSHLSQEAAVTLSKKNMGRN